jgi:type I restriction enzyme S subunit
MTQGNFITTYNPHYWSVNKPINDNLEQQAQALFKSWFVDFEPFKDGKFVDSELG